MAKIPQIIVEPNENFDNGESAAEKINQAMKSVTIGEGLSGNGTDEDPLVADGATRGIEAKTDNFTAAKNINYFVDASTNEVIGTLPVVEANDYSRYFFTLSKNSNHGKIIVAGETQLIGDKSFLSLATVNGYVELVANGVDGYNIIANTNINERPILVTGDLALSGGFESGAQYIGNLTASQSATVTLSNAVAEHLGQVARFTKITGDQAIMRIVSEDGTFDESITDDQTGFRISVVFDSIGNKYTYSIQQDSRTSENAVTVNILATNQVSTLVPTYLKSETGNFAEVELESVVIDSTDQDNPTTLATFINEDADLVGFLSQRNVNSVGNIKIGGDKNKSQFRIQYIKIDAVTLVETFLSQTGWSVQVDNDETFQEITLSGILPENTWKDDAGTSNDILMTRLQAVKKDDNKSPTLIIKLGGETPARTSLSVAASNIRHSSLGDVTEAKTGIVDGHVNNSKPLQFPELTTAQRDAVASPNAGMKIFNTTKGNIEEYKNGFWQPKEYEALPAGAAVAYNLATGRKKTLSVAVDSTITFSNPKSGMNAVIIVEVTVISTISFVLSGATFKSNTTFTDLAIGTHAITLEWVSATECLINRDIYTTL